ncbi:MAG: DUF1800 family protein [Flavicella sp.]
MDSLSPYIGKLGKRLAKHLLRRASFCISKDRIQEFSDYSVDQAIAKLLVTPEKYLKQPIHYVSGNLSQPSPWINDDPDYGPVNLENGSGKVKRNNYLTAWWMDEARRDTSIRSKMAYFLSTNFTASIRSAESEHYFDYLSLLDFFALGNWREFCFQMTKNNVMLKYLNNDENTKTNPNENFAREVLELFTIGKGPQIAVGDYTNYTESDVEQAAKTLTGWTYTKNRNESRKNGAAFGNIPCGHIDTDKHDFSAKQFSKHFGYHKIEPWDVTGKSTAEKEARVETELRSFFDMILSQDETAKFICRKLYRYFVARTIDTYVESNIIVPLAVIFRKEYDLKETITTLLKSRHFYDADDLDSTDEIIGGMVKSPLDLVLQIVTLTEFPVPDPIIHGKDHYKSFYFTQLIKKIMVKSGQDIFMPLTVAGFPAYYEAPDFDKFWFNTSTIISRYNLGAVLLHSNKTKSDFSVSSFVDVLVSEPTDPTVLVKEISDLLFVESISDARLSFFVNDVLLDNGSLNASMWSDEWIAYKNTGKKNNVDSALEPLFLSLLWSQEFQIN